MNPFDLRGPAFLLFYGVLGGAGFIYLVMARWRQESGNAPYVNMTDPYQIAFLRGGAIEVLRVATISLIDRGLLTVINETDLRATEGSPLSVRHVVEQYILKKFKKRDSAISLFSDEEALLACESVRAPAEAVEIIARR